MYQLFIENIFISQRNSHADENAREKAQQSMMIMTERRASADRSSLLKFTSH